MYDKKRTSENKSFHTGLSKQSFGCKTNADVYANSVYKRAYNYYYNSIYKVATNSNSIPSGYVSIHDEQLSCSPVPSSYHRNPFLFSPAYLITSLSKCSTSYSTTRADFQQFSAECNRADPREVLSVVENRL
ncbi:hypothetical protein M8J75_013904 [Diaphorina citri]|nr:hypothetical protein M8J75_013904 [Diaphorina citri]